MCANTGLCRQIIANGPIKSIFLTTFLFSNLQTSVKFLQILPLDLS